MSANKDSAGNWKNPFFVEGESADELSRSLLLGSELREKVRRGFALGTFVIELPDPATVTTIALAGFDFAVLDMEHSPLDFGRLTGLIDAGRAAGLALLVRPWGEDSGLIGKILDIGAHGIMAPHVDTPGRARGIVDQARFAPLGKRGFSPLSKFDAIENPLKALGESTYVVVQIEGRDAIDRVAEIAAVPGIDAVFVGPYDLALSLGVPPGSKPVFAAAQRIADAAPEGLGLGIYVDDPATCRSWAERGFALQCVSFDARMLSNGARSVARQASDSFESASLDTAAAREVE